MRVDCLDYRQIPDQNPLFLHYLYQSDRADSSFSPVHLSLEHLKLRAESLLKCPPRYPREKLLSVLKFFHEKVGVGESVRENLEKLKSPQTVAVLTGQQIGFLGGASLAVYKAATAIRLARILEEQGVTAVPVFWMASDDSDFQEVRSAHFFNERDELLQEDYPESSRKAGQVVGSLSLEFVDELLNRVEEKAGGDKERDLVMRMLREAYSSRRSFGEAFGAWLSGLFRDYGLLLFDPLSCDYKSDLRSAFLVAIERRKEIVRALRRRAEFLKSAGFNAQVETDDSETLLFLMEKEKRFKLHYSDGEYHSRKRRVHFKEPELRPRLEANPEEFGPNVLLRPIIQDHLFPTLVYIGGPSEISYFSQVSAISTFWGMEMAVFPRASVTVVDRKAQRLLRKYDLKVTDIFSCTPFQIRQRILERSSDRPVLEEFDSLRQEVEERLGVMGRNLVRADPGVAEMLGRAEKKIIYQIDKVKNRFINNYESRGSNLERHLDYLYSHLYPHDKLQERVINFNQFLMQEGFSFIHHLVDAVSPFCRGHQVLYV